MKGSYLQTIDNAADDLRHTSLLGELNGGFDDLTVITAVKRHTPDPKRLEEVGQDIVLDVLWRDTLGRSALLDDLEHNLLHFLIRRLEFADKDDCYFLSIVRSVLGVHKRDDETNSLQESCQTLATM